MNGSSTTKIMVLCIFGKSSACYIYCTPKKICDDVSLNVKRLLTLRTLPFSCIKELSLSLKFEVQRGRINRFLQLPIYIQY